MILLMLALTGLSPVQSTPRPAVPVPVTGGGNLDPCALGVVHGLKAGGDGFLSVRGSPGTSGRELDRLRNGAKVFTCAERGDWIGVVYSPRGSDCGLSSPVLRTGSYAGPCRSGWAHRRWIEVIAG